MIKEQTTSNKVNDWFFERGLELADPMAQFTKLVEEVAELGVAIVKEDEDEIIDALGDIQVVLHGLSLQLEVNLSEALDVAYNVIKDRKGKLINGIWVKEEDL